MNIVGRLLDERNMSQKELAEALGISQPSVCAWVSQKSDPKGVNARKIAELFGVDRDSIVIKEAQAPPSPASGLTEADLEKIANLVQAGQPSAAPRTVEARIVSFGMDKLPAETRELILGMIRGMFANKPEAEYFMEKKGEAD